MLAVGEMLQMMPPNFELLPFSCEQLKKIPEMWRMMTDYLICDLDVKCL